MNNPGVEFLKNFAMTDSFDEKGFDSYAQAV
jgi:hypothetical protein